MNNNEKNCDPKNSVEPITPDPTNPDECDLIAPTTEPQREIWSLAAISPEASCSFNLSNSIMLKGPLDINAMRRALEILPQRHEALRMTFADNGLHVLIHKKNNNTIPFIDRTGASPLLGETSVDDIVQKEMTTPFNLTQGPLWRPIIIKTAENSYVIVITVHHIICDGWSLGILRRELRFLYGEIKNGRHAATDAISRFSQYAELMASKASTTEYANDEAYWVNQFTLETPVIDLPMDHPRPLARSYNASCVNRTIAPEIASQLRSAASGSGASLFTLLFAVYCILVRRLSNSKAAVIGVPVAGQPLMGQNDLMGHCVHFLPVLQKVPLDVSFEAFLQSVSDTLLDAQDHHSCTFGSILRQLKLPRDPSRIPLVSLCLTYIPVLKKDIEPFLDLETDYVANSRRYETFEFNIDITDIAGRLDLRCHFNANLFNDATIHRFLGYFESIACSLIKQPTIAIGRIPLLSQSERQRVVLDWNSTKENLPFKTTLNRLFEEQVRGSPNAPAVLFENLTLSYRQLDNWSNHIAQLLITKGAGPGSFIALCAERSLDMVAGLMGILKSGAAYVPIDPAYPDARIAYILSDAKPLAVLTQRTLLNKFTSSASMGLIPLEDTYDPQKSSPPSQVRVTPEDIAYVIYTSGSTGTPKGVMIPHRGVCNRLLWMQKEFMLTDTDRVLQKTPYTFDVSVWEFFWPLITGAGLVMARPGGHVDAAYLVDTIRKAEITVIHFVPSMLGFFIEEDDALLCESLRYVICSGEALTPAQRDRFFERMPPHVRLFNLYGPTEASVDVSVWECKRDDTRPTVPIGRPIANIQLYVLDDFMQPAPIGVCGELHIGGVGLARGYLNRTELTKEKFIPNPLATSPSETSEFLYKTGDLARWLDDGSIEYLGRIDFQIKIRGFRIELGEIEKSIGQFDGVVECAVIVHEEKANDKRLSAYVTGAADLDAQEIRNRLRGQLPEYMIPSYVVILEKLPKTSSGKIDRKALMACSVEPSREGIAIVGPRNETERAIAGIWAKELAIASVSVMENFFDLGGHSLLMLKIFESIKKISPHPVALLDLFQYPTIASLAQHIDGKNDREDTAGQALRRAQLQRDALHRKHKK